jgi:hypothetical protein
MALVINSMKTCVNYLFLVKEINTHLSHYFKELQYRSVLLHAEEGQQITADGLLPGTVHPLHLGF